jgi:hypothetical protein
MTVKHGLFTKQAINKTDPFECKILQKIFGPTNKQGVWRIIQSEQLYQMYKDIPLATYIRIKRLKQAGQVNKDREPMHSKEDFRRKFQSKKAGRKTT